MSAINARPAGRGNRGTDTYAIPLLQPPCVLDRNRCWHQKPRRANIPVKHRHSALGSIESLATRRCFQTYCRSSPRSALCRLLVSALGCEQTTASRSLRRPAEPSVDSPRRGHKDGAAAGRAGIHSRVDRRQDRLMNPATARSISRSIDARGREAHRPLP